MTRKFFSINVFLLVVMIFLFSACNDASSSKSTVSESTVSESTVSESTVSESTASDASVFDIDIDTSSRTPESMINLYLISAWSGNYFKNGVFTAEIRNGILFVNGESTHKIPDLGYQDNSSIGYKIVKYNSDGTWVFDQFSYQLECWKRGIRIFHRKLNGFSYETTFVCNDNFIVARYGENLEVLTLQGQTTSTLNNVIDCCNDGTIKISDFQHKNYTVDDGKINPLESHYVRFRRIQSDTPEHEGGNCYQSSTGTTYFVDAEGKFWKIADDRKILAILPEGKGYELISINRETEEYVVSIYNKLDVNYTICIIRDGTVEIATSSASDYNVAYQMLYWMDQEGKVYSQHWTDPSALSELFFEVGAYAVSPFTDEAQGALVPHDQANWDGYGYTNIYSPYGEKK